MLRITVSLVDEESATMFTDAFNEWARYPDIDVLMNRTTDTPSGDPESAYSFEWDEDDRAQEETIGLYLAHPAFWNPER